MFFWHSQNYDQQAADILLQIQLKCFWILKFNWNHRYEQE